MVKAVLLFILGLLLLIKGGDWFVDGAVGVARRLKLPEILIGATVVSIGTTLPEVIVSATSALVGVSEMAYGNAVGSIICNTALIAAITIAVKPGPVERKSLGTPVIFFFAAAVFFSCIAYMSGSFSRLAGVVLLGMFVLYIVTAVLQMKKNPVAEETEDIQEILPLPKALLLLAVGAVVIAVGANLLVNNGTYIAETLGVPKSVIALTFVALGTSLPELVTAITSLAKGHGSLSLGNVIGANLFNLVLVCGTSITLKPFSIPREATLFGINSSLILDLPLMFLVMLLMTVPTLIRGKLSRIQGILLLILYFGFCGVQFRM